ncbi:hypothetical protein KBD33_05155, partial [Candidatus Gracilibacteria bacterium]|nr:hypothetical protein [Candidatus Gracilibacteria bacterium]
MKKSAPSRSILSLFLFFGVGLSVVFAVVNSEIFPNGTSGTQSQGAGWASPAISSKEITIWNGTCRKITSTTGTQYYIPTYSQAHWDRFVANKPSGITIGYCPPTATITASPLSVVYGNGTNLTWSSTNTDYCERTGVNPVTYGTWPSGAIATGSTIYTNPLINSPTTFYLRCHGLDGTYATANVTVSINPIIGECNNAVMLGCKSGQIAFNDNGQESCNTTRTWQCRGQFGGSNSPQCSKANTTCVSCSSPWGGAAIAHGSSITAYASSSVACGNTCSSQTRTCNDGSLNGSYTNSSCSVATCASCSSPWGGAAIAHGSSITAYASSSVACGNTCSSQTRTCNDGSLGGSFTRSSCNVDSCTTSGPYTLGSWGSCTGPCGTNNGTQSRTVSCGYTTCTGQSNTSQ